MVIQVAIKVIAFLVALYAAWYVFSFFSAWGGIAIAVVVVVGVLAYFEKQIKELLKSKD